MHITTSDACGGTYTLPSKRLPFFRPANLPGAQEEIWQATTGISSRTWASYFERCQFDVTMAVAANQNAQTFVVAASMLGHQEGSSPVEGYPKSTQGYMSMLYDLDFRAARIIGANVNSKRAHQAGFIRHMMEGFQRFAEDTKKVDKIGAMAVGAGVYTWTSYGAVPDSPRSTAWSIKQQWNKLAELPLGKIISPEIGRWVERLSAEPTDTNFRSIFVQAADHPAIAQGMKTLLLGDPRFLSNPQHRYNAHEVAPVKFADVLNNEFNFHPQDPQFQAFFRQRLARLERS